MFENDWKGAARNKNSCFRADAGTRWVSWAPQRARIRNENTWKFFALSKSSPSREC